MNEYPALLATEDVPGVDEEALAAACTLVRNYCGWHIAPSVTETLVVNGPGTLVLTLPTIKVTALTKITENGTDLPAGGFDWSEVGLVEKRAPCPGLLWTGRLSGIRVDLTHGWAECPKDVKAVVKRIATQGIGTARVASVGTGPFSVSYFDDDPYSSAILDRYQR